MTYELGQRCLHNNNKNCSKALISSLIRLVFTFKIKDESFYNNYDNDDRCNSIVNFYFLSFGVLAKL